MARGYRRLSLADEDEIWTRLRAGHAAKPTARALGLSTGTVRAYLVRCGGIRPDPRRRSPGRLSFADARRSPRGLAAGRSLRAIAAGLGRAPSTVSREVAGRGGRYRYRAARADQIAWSRSRSSCSTASRPNTTITVRTAPCRTERPPPRSTTRCPEPSPGPAATPRATTGSATTASTSPAPSPCESTASSATSASDEPTREPTSSLLIQDLEVRIVNAVTGELLRELTIDTSKDYQPRTPK